MTGATVAAAGTHGVLGVDAVGAPPRGTPGRFTGWFRMYRLVLRRDRIRLFVWTAGVSALVFSSSAAIRGTYPTRERLLEYAALAQGKAVVIVQAGPGFGLDDPTHGAVLMNEASLWTLIGVAIMSILMVTRHTRAEEESMRAELLRATPLGRDAAPVAAVLGVLTVNLLISGVVAAGLVVSDYDPTGSLAFAATVLGTGMVFAAISLVTGQIASSSRAGSGLALVVLGASFVLRAVGDVGNGVLSWFSPLGWGQAIRAFAAERWWVLGLELTATVALVAVASVLVGHRDFGAGMIDERAGRAEAGPGLSSALGLAVRLQRGAFLGWLVGVGIFGAFYGVVTDAVEDMLRDQPELADVMAQAGVGSITDSFLATAAMMTALLACGYVISAVLRLHGEESAGRVEPLLATPTPRTAWAGSHLVAAGAGLVAVLVTAGLGLGGGAALVTGDAGRVPQMVGVLLTYVPSVAVLAGVAFLLCCVAPRWAMLSWLGLAVAVVVGLFGEILDLPGFVRGLSPLYHVPAAPAVEVNPVPLALSCVVASVLVAVGMAGVTRRDIDAS